jgi:hypothetical protein
MISTLDNRDHSYNVRVSRGDRVRFNQPTRCGVLIDSERWQYRHFTAQPGDEATVLSESNAGFRGIEASLVFDNGDRVHSVSTGRLEVV